MSPVPLLLLTFSLVLGGHSAGRGTTVPTLATVHHDSRLLAGGGAAHLLLHVRAVLDVLVEIAHVAADFLVRLE